MPLCTLFPRGPGVAVSQIIKSGSLIHKYPPLPSSDPLRSVCCIPEQAATASLEGKCPKRSRFIIFYHFTTPPKDQDDSPVDLCRKFEFEIMPDGTLRFVKEKVVTGGKTQKAAWNKHPSFIRRLHPIGEPLQNFTPIELEQQFGIMMIPESEQCLEEAVREGEEIGFDFKTETEDVEGAEEPKEGFETETGFQLVIKRDEGAKKEIGGKEKRKEEVGKVMVAEVEEEEQEKLLREEERQAYSIYARRFALYGMGDHIAVVSPVADFSGDGTWRLLVNDRTKARTSTHVMFISIPELVCQMIACGVKPKDVPSSLIQGKHGCVGLEFEPTYWRGPRWLRGTGPDGEDPPRWYKNEGWWYSWKPRMDVWVC